MNCEVLKVEITKIKNGFIVGVVGAPPEELVFCKDITAVHQEVAMALGATPPEPPKPEKIPGVAAEEDL